MQKWKNLRGTIKFCSNIHEVINLQTSYLLAISLPLIWNCPSRKSHVIKWTQLFHRKEREKEFYQHTRISTILPFLQQLCKEPFGYTDKAFTGWTCLYLRLQLSSHSSKPPLSPASPCFQLPSNISAGYLLTHHEKHFQTELSVHSPNPNLVL